MIAHCHNVILPQQDYLLLLPVHQHSFFKSKEMCFKICYMRGVSFVANKTNSMSVD